MAQPVRGPDGQITNFPDGMSDTDIHARMLARYGSGAGLLPSSPGQKPSVPALTPDIVDKLGGIQQNSTIGNDSKMLPMLGSFLGPEGTAAGMLAHQALSSEGPSGKSAIEDALSNEVIPRGVVAGVAGLGKLGGIVAKKLVDAKNNPAVQDWVGRQISKLSPFSDPQLVEQGASNARDLARSESQPIPQAPNQITGPLYGPESQSVAGGQQPIQSEIDFPTKQARDIKGRMLPKDKPLSYDELYQQKQNSYPVTSNGGTNSSPVTSPGPGQSAFTNNEIGNQFRNFGAEAPGTAEPVTVKSITNKLPTDVTHVRNSQLVAGPEVTEGLLTNHAISKGFNTETNTIQPGKILDELGNNPDVYKEGMSQTTKDNLTGFLNKVQELEGSGEKPNGMLKYVGHRLTFDMAMKSGALIGGAGGLAASHSLMGGGAGMAIGGGTVILGSKALQALSQSPMVGKMAIKALEVPATDAAAPFYQKAIMTALKGIPVIYRHSDGSEENAIMSPNGPQARSSVPK